MNPLLGKEVNLNDLLSYYFERAEKETNNMVRVKRFYSDEDSFNEFMEKIISKDQKRLDRLMEKDLIPNPWRIFYVLLDIALEEGEVVKRFDTLTRMFPSKTVKYMGWIFSWVHGENTLISIFNRENELVYRF